MDAIDEELLAEMRKAGIRSVTYGFESGSQKILDAMNKRVKAEDNYKAVRLTKRAGLAAYGDVLIGYPGEDEETIAETERFLIKARPTAMNMHALVPFPGTPVYEEAKMNGTLVGDWTIHGSLPYVKLPWMDDRSTLLERVRRITRRYYTNPLVLWGLLWHLRFRFTRRQLVHGCRYMRHMIRFGQ